MFYFCFVTLHFQRNILEQLMQNELFFNIFRSFYLKMLLDL